MKNIDITVINDQMILFPQKNNARPIRRYGAYARNLGKNFVDAQSAQKK